MNVGLSHLVLEPLLSPPPIIFIEFHLICPLEFTTSLEVSIARVKTATWLVRATAVATSSEGLLLERGPCEGTIFIRLILVDLVPNLCSRFASAKLPPELEAWVPINSYLSAINCLQVEAIYSLLRFFTCGVFNKAETAGSLLYFIESHDQVNYLTALAEKLKKLTLICVKREIAHVERGWYLQSVLIFVGRKPFKWIK